MAVAAPDLSAEVGSRLGLTAAGPLTGMVGSGVRAERARPLALAREQVLPVLDPLAPLLPGGALRRSATVAVGGEAGCSLALALVAGPSQAGSWVAVVGLPALGLLAAAGLGVALERLVLVAEPPPEAWATVMAALVGAVDVVVAGPPPRVGAGDARRLAARVRERGTVVVTLPDAGADSRTHGPGLEVDLRLTAGASRWVGLGWGHGHLQARRVSVEAVGRREAARPRRVELWLPGPHGEVASAEAEVLAWPGVAPGATPSARSVPDAG